MNPFLSLRSRALNHGLAGQMTDLDQFLASQAFLDRIAFRGAAGVQDMLAVTFHMLKRVALDPRELEATQVHLEEGTVVLTFFGVCNVVPVFDLPVGSPELHALLDAISENVASDMFKAAKRTLRWREPGRARMRGAQERAVLDTHRSRLPWPDASDYKKDRATAEVRTSELVLQMNQKEVEIRNRRNDRLARLAHASAPNLGSWYDLLEDIATVVLRPRMH